MSRSLMMLHTRRMRRLSSLATSVSVGGKWWQDRLMIWADAAGVLPRLEPAQTKWRGASAGRKGSSIEKTVLTCRAESCHTVVAAHDFSYQEAPFCSLPSPARAGAHHSFSCDSHGCSLAGEVDARRCKKQAVKKHVRNLAVWRRCCGAVQKVIVDDDEPGKLRFQQSAQRVKSHART